MTEVVGLGVLLVAAIVATLIVLTAVVARAAIAPPRRTAGYAIARNMPVDPGDLGLEFEAWTLDRPGGARLPVWEIAGRDPEGCAAVFVHDWMASRIDDLAALGDWPDRASRLVLYDRRGHGEAIGRGRLGHRESEDLDALLDRLGEGPFVLVALGAGGAIARGVRSDHVTDVITDGPAETYTARLADQLQAIRCPRFLAPLAIAALGLTGIRPADP